MIPIYWHINRVNNLLPLLEFVLEVDFAKDLSLPMALVIDMIETVKSFKGLPYPIEPTHQEMYCNYEISFSILFPDEENLNEFFSTLI